MKILRSEREYQNTAEHNKYIYDFYTNKTNEIDYLKHHRDTIERDRLGYGDRAFTSMWNDIVDALPNEFSFLEIGVFKGQVITNIALSADKLNKEAVIYGVSPFTSYEAGFLYTNAGSYKQDVINLFNYFNINIDNIHLIEGLSQDADIITKIENVQPFDIVYIDGDHRYNGVMSDLKIYSKYVKKNGMLIIDDSANNLPHLMNGNEPIYFLGIPDVSNACKDFFTENTEWQMTLAVGHNTCWRRVE